MMNKIVNGLIKQKSIVIILLILWMGFGMYSYYVIPKQENPDASLPAAIITTVYPGASPEEVETSVSKKLEDALKELPKVDVLDSISMNSASVVVVLFEIDVDGDEALSNLRQIVEDVQTELPQMCQESVVDTDLNKAPQFIISLSGDEYTQEDLVSYAQSIKDNVLEVDGVTKIKIDGELDKEVIVEVDFEALDLYNISIEVISDVLMGQNLSIPSGSLDYDTGVINVKTPATFETLKDIEDIVIMGSSTDSVGFVYIKDVADVYIDRARGYSYRQNKENAIMISGYFDSGTNAVIIGEGVRTAIEESKSQMPPDIDFHEVMFSPEDIDKSVTDFIFNLLQSIGLIVIVVMIGVRLKNAVIVSLALPISILTTFIVMFWLGIEFHFISIMALIISLGILVDNAIVISDAIQQKLNDDHEINEAINLAVKETMAPILTSTLTTILTFGILFFIPGTVGEVVATIPLVVVTALVASYIVAMFVIPLFASMVFEKESNEKITKKPNIIRRGFDKALVIGLKYKKSTIVLALSTLAIAAVLVMSLGIVFFPYSDKPVIYMNINAEKYNLENTEKIVDDIHDVLLEFDEVEAFSTAIGKGLPTFFLTVPRATEAENFAQIMIELDYENSEYDSNEEIGFDIQKELDKRIVGANVEIKYLEYSMPTDAKIALEIKGSDLTELKNVSNDIQELLSIIPGTTNVKDDSVDNEYEYIVDLDNDLVTMMGLIKYDVVKQINTALMGAETSNYISGGVELPIIVKSNVKTLDDLYRFPIMSSAVDTQVLLSQIADVKLSTSIPTINRSDGKRTITITSDVLPGHSSSTIMSELKAEINSLLPSGVDVRYNGEMAQMMALLSNLVVAGLIAIILIYIILLFQFQDYTKPFIILMSIPLSFIGSFLGLYIFKMDLQAMALLGLVSLIGVVVNNGIILVEVMDSEVESGSSVYDACKNAVNKRYRAITLSTITTCIGLVPLILSGDPMSSPMASVLLFGLMFSTILTMVIVPVMYSLFEVDENDLDSLSLKKLRKVCKSNNIDYQKSDNKAQIIEKINSFKTS